MSDPPVSESQAPPFQGDPEGVRLHGDLRDLIGAVQKWASPEGVMMTLATGIQSSNEAMREGNKIAKNNQRVIWALLVFFAFLVALIVIEALILNSLVTRIEQMSARLDQNMTKLESVEQRAVKTDEKVAEVKAAADAVAEKEASEPQLVVVPETDPKKAAKNPLKLRVTQPKTATPRASVSASSSMPPVPTTVEVPLQVKDAQVRPSATP